MECDKRVLVVEDDEATREGLVDLLRDTGFLAVGVANGREALEHLRRGDEPPCAILLDVMMPIMGGVEFRKLQLQDPGLCGVPVIIVSAVDRVLAEVLHANAYVGKPIDIPLLVDSVQAYC